jgi:hypothetical protein
MVERSKLVSRNDWSGLLQMLGYNEHKVSNKEKKEIKVIKKSNKGKEGKKK